MNSNTMSRELERLKTIELWPVSFIDVIKAVKSGLFYAGHKDFLECFSCKSRLGNWKIGDDPDTRHKEVNPSCQVVLLKERKKKTKSRKNVLYNESPYPRLPSNTDIFSRLSTFKNWPSSASQSKLALANAGFIYIGFGDKTMCYHCGGILKDWGVSCKDPWVEHAYNMPKCQYVIDRKGDEFIRKTLVQKEAEKRSENKVGEEVSYESHEDANVMMCKLCFEEKDITCCVPCGHAIACVSCARGLKECAICRSPIREIVRLYFS